MQGDDNGDENPCLRMVTVTSRREQQHANTREMLAYWPPPRDQKHVTSMLFLAVNYIIIKKFLPQHIVSHFIMLRSELTYDNGPRISAHNTVLQQLSVSSQQDQFAEHCARLEVNETHPSGVEQNSSSSCKKLL